MENVYLILYNIRSVHNVGSVLRTADGAGVRAVYLCGCTPTPIDRFGRKRKDLAKVALGAEDVVETRCVEELIPLIQSLKERGIDVVALEQNTRSVPYHVFKRTKPIALILGEETQGIPPEIISCCDAVIEIPMYGKKESLNVSVAAGIVLFELAKQ